MPVYIVKGGKRTGFKRKNILIKKIIFNTGGKEYGYYVSKKFLTEHRGKI